MQNVIYSARIVDNKIIAIHGDETINLTATEYVDELSYEIILEDEKIYLLVYSPVESRVTIGMDIVVFDLSNVLDKMDLGNILIDVIKKEEIAEYQYKATINPLINEYKSSNDTVYLNIFYEINDNHLLHVSTTKDLFYKKFYKIAKTSGICLIIVSVLSFIGINLIIISFAKKKIVSLDISNEKHKRDSYYDTLIGAYTRLYLDQWLKENNNKLDYSIVLIDIDNFKNINDKYGHQKGDEVLRAIVLLIKNEIRDNDFVVRYGGDEFIILLNCDCRDVAIDIIERINRSLELSHLLELEVSFSYGVGELKNSSEFYDIFKEIDSQMYKMKKYTSK